jgi:hypothetical protein
MEYLLFSEGFRVFMGKSFHASFFTSILFSTIAITIGLLLFTVNFICPKSKPYKINSSYKYFIALVAVI